MTIPIPKNESDRLAALDRYKILDSSPEESFDRITRVVAAYLDVPIALVSLVDGARQWFKSRHGLDAEETPREVAFCAHAIMNDQVFTVPDASQDPRFRENPLVTGSPDIRFYAGAPLTTEDGFNLGTLCAIDAKPREITEEQQSILADLARVVMDMMELRLAGNTAREEIAVRQRAEAAREDEEARTRSIVETVIDGIVTIDENGIIQTFNPAAERLFGYGAEDVHGRNISMLMPEPYSSRHDGYLANYLATGDAKIIGIGREVEGLRKDGSTFPMDLAVSEMGLSGRRMFTGVVRDITERKQIDRMKNEFVSTVSHELRTPLTSIKGSLGLIRGGQAGAMPNKMRPMIEIAYSNTDRLVRLINDILDIEKIEAGMLELKIQALEIGPLLEQVIEANKAFGEEFEVKFVLRPRVPAATVNGDPDRLMQVFTNLLSNAAKFSPAGEEVEISATCRSDFLRVSVSDRGPGIPPEFQDRLFDKFSQADVSPSRRKGGTGLGLGIAQAIVERHGGSMGFVTAAGEGTTFHVDLPV